MDNVRIGRRKDGSAGPFSRSGTARRLALPAALLSVALGAAQLAAASPSLAAGSASSSRVAVGATPALPKGAVSAAAPTASTKLSLDIELNTGHANELAAYAAAVGDRNSPYYHRYLRPSEIAEYFGASPTEVAAVRGGLEAEGLTVGSLSADGMFVTATGTVAQVEHAFSVTIAGYRDASRTFYANTTAPTLPGSVASLVSQVVGIDDVAYARPMDVQTHHAAKAGTSASSTKTSNVTPAYTNNSCSDIATVYSNVNEEEGEDLQDGSGYYTADTVAGIYGTSTELADGDDGAGVTVAVFELEAYDPTGVSMLNKCYGHDTSVSEVKVDGGPTAAANLYSNVGVESALDIENIADAAPGVKIVDYAGPDADLASNSQYLDTWAAIFNQDEANVVSSSWGECETLDQAGDSSLFSEENTLFEQAAAQGQTVLAASGDSGSTACYGQNPDSTADNSILNVSDPASQPYVTGVGGTGMTGTSSPPQTVWNSSQTYDGTTYYGAGGGGVSDYESLPSYQDDAIGADYSTYCSTAATTGCREVPDVSALADPNDGYVIEEYYNDGTAADTGYYYDIVGGTSGAAPEWAAIIALADAGTGCRLNGEAGFINDDLYTAGENATTAAAAFTDITSGNNWISAYGGPDAYPSETGYDLASGWGAPKATGVAANVCQAAASSADGYFVSDGPTRIMDTRKDLGADGPIAASGTASLQVSGVDGVPSDGTVTAVVLNVTVADPTGGGYATVYPDGKAKPNASNINFSAGEALPNLVTVPLESDGKVDFANSSGGTIQFVADLEGYYTTNSSAAGASTYVADGPTRVLDTRKDIGGVTGPVAALGTAKLALAGVAGVPSNGTVTSVVMNVTVTAPTGGGYATVYPDGTTTPSASNVNFSKGETIPNLVTVPLGADGDVDFYNASTGTVQFVADLEGYYEEGTSGAKYHALSPTRLIDTRIGEGETSVSPLAKSGGTLSLALPSSYSAVVANLTVTAPVGGGYLSVYPIGGTPSSSNVNFSADETIANLGLITSKSGIVFSSQATGTTQLVMDLEGYFSAN